MRVRAVRISRARARESCTRSQPAGAPPHAGLLCLHAAQAQGERRVPPKQRMPLLHSRWQPEDPTWAVVVRGIKTIAVLKNLAYATL